jgi:hypothetical protein
VNGVVDGGLVSASRRKASISCSSLLAKKSANPSLNATQGFSWKSWVSPSWAAAHVRQPSPISRGYAQAWPSSCSMFQALEVNRGSMWMSCRIGSDHDPFGARVAGLWTVVWLRNGYPSELT